MLRTNSVDALTFHRDIVRYVLPEFDAEVNPSDVSYASYKGAVGTQGGMRLYYLERRLWLQRPKDELFAFFCHAENLAVLTPPWLDFRLVEKPQALGLGALIRYRMRWRWLPLQWTTKIIEWGPPHRFADRQIAGPYHLWNHQHSFLSRDGGTLMQDSVTYAVPLGWIGRVAQTLLVRRDIMRIFDFRADTLRRLFPPKP